MANRYASQTPDQADRERERKLRLNRKRQNRYEDDQQRRAKYRRLPDKIGPKYSHGVNQDSYRNV